MSLKRIIIAGAIGTTFMTLYSYWASKKEREQFLEPALLNELAEDAEVLPEAGDEETNPVGWAGHYGQGFVFVAAYYYLYRNALQKPSVAKGIFAGAVSGIIGIAIWEAMFRMSKNPPKTERYRYYRQLFIAHLIFSTFAIYGYRLPDVVKQLR